MMREKGGQAARVRVSITQRNNGKYSLAIQHFDKTQPYVHVQQCDYSYVRRKLAEVAGSTVLDENLRDIQQVVRETTPVSFEQISPMYALFQECAKECGFTLESLIKSHHPEKLRDLVLDLAIKKVQKAAHRVISYDTPGQMNMQNPYLTSANVVWKIQP